MWDSGINESDSPAFISNDSGLGSPLTNLLMSQAIVPGTGPGYQLCKTIFSYHPLGAILTDAPITRAQAKPREISIPMLAEERLKKQFMDTAKTLGKVGMTMLIHNLMSASRMYGIASIAVGELGRDTSTPLDVNRISKADLYFNILDPLNTAGSLVLDQNPNSPTFLKPAGPIHVNGQHWHGSRVRSKMNEQPLYIDWTSSAFGFVGRSVYQRALYPLKSFIQSLITDQLVVQKAGLLVYKAESPGSFIDNVIQTFFGQKRAAVKQGVTGQVLSIGLTEMIETLNMQNLDKAYDTARTNILKNIASACGMPASIIIQETLATGLADGTEDVKKEIEYLDYIRTDMDMAYSFLDQICMYKAWTPEFYATLQAEYPYYGEGGFERARYDWMNAFKASWPNLMLEPDSEKVKTEDVQMKSVIAMLEVMLPEADPETRANLMAWAADNVNDRELLFSSALDIDPDKIKAYFETKEAQEQQAAEEMPQQPAPFKASA